MQMSRVLSSLSGGTTEAGLAGRVGSGPSPICHMWWFSSCLSHMIRGSFPLYQDSNLDSPIGVIVCRATDCRSGCMVCAGLPDPRKEPRRDGDYTMADIGLFGVLRCFSWEARRSWRTNGR